MAKRRSLNVILLIAALMAGCGTVKEKTAPCKRPANLASFADNPPQACGAMHRVNDPVAAFATIGVMGQDQR